MREYEEGFLMADVPLGQGCLDLQAMVDILRKAKPGMKFSLEMLTRDPLKIPCLTDKYWASFVGVSGRDGGPHAAMGARNMQFHGCLRSPTCRLPSKQPWKRQICERV